MDATTDKHSAAGYNMNASRNIASAPPKGQIEWKVSSASDTATATESHYSSRLTFILFRLTFVVHPICKRFTFT